MTAWWMRRTLLGRFVAGFGALLVLLAFMAGTGYVSARLIRASVDDIFSVRLPALDAVLEADRDLQQLLVAERSMIFADVASETFGELLKAYEENLQQADERWEKYKSLATTPEERAVVQAYEAARVEWRALSRQIVDGRRADTMEGRALAIDLTLGQAREKFDAMREHVNDAQELNLKLAEQQFLRANQTYRSARNGIALLGLFAVGSGFGLAWLIGFTTSRQIDRIAVDLRVGADQVVSAANGVSASAQDLSRGASNQAAELEQTSASMEEMASMTQQTATHAGRASTLTHDVDQRVGESNRALTSMVASMSAIIESSQRVSRIIKTIDEIAFQTNILALNAAVEAARAGEAGMGFAVVADEVRSLAQRAAQAARDTTSLIDESLQRTREGSEHVGLVARSIEAITGSVHELKTLVADVGEASRQQAMGISQVTQSMSRMEKVTQSTAAAAEESAAASEEMHGQAELALSLVLQLESLVGGLKASGTRQSPVALERGSSQRVTMVVNSAPRRTGTFG